MKTLSFLLLTCAISFAFSDLKPIFQLSQDIDTPESVYYDEGSQSIFVSNVSGAPDQKDGKGWISKYDSSGRLIKGQWVAGLDAPKGMRSFKGNLYVTNITEVVVINILQSKITKRIAIPKSKFLNDLAVDAAGNLYVSDTVKNAILVIKGNKIETLIEGEVAESPNGLVVVDNELYVASWGAGMKADWSTEKPGTVYAIDLKTHIKRTITGPLGNLDGIEKIAGGEILVSDWRAGKVYRLSADGTLLWSQGGYKGSADLGWNPEKNQWYLPRMAENLVDGYAL